MNFDTPILLIIFNRPDTVLKVIEALRRVQPSELYIAADGPRPDKPGEDVKCEATRKLVLESIDWQCNVRTLFRKDNLGCGRGPAHSIDWFFSNVEKGIILEDDCVPSLSFFTFCDTLLDYYRDNDKIMHISGSNYLSLKFYPYSYYFTFTPIVWGWATWRRAWRKYDYEIKDYELLKSSVAIEPLLEKKLDAVFHKKITSCWDYQWNYIIVKNNGICINPTKNLILNYGFGTDSTHTALMPWWYENLKLENLNGLNHPGDITVNKSIEKKLVERIHLNKISFGGRILRKLKSIKKQLQ